MVSATKEQIVVTNPWEKACKNLLKIMKPIASVGNIVASFALFIMVSFTFVDVFLRYIFKSPIAGSNEIVECSMVAVVFFAAAYAQLSKSHVSMDIITVKLSKNNRLAIETAVNFLSIIVVAFFLWESCFGVSGLLSSGKVTAAMRIPEGLVALIVPMGTFILFTLLIKDQLENIFECLKMGFSKIIWTLIIIMPPIIASLLILFATSTPTLGLPIIGLIGFVVLFIFFFTGMPVAYVLLMIGFIFLSHIRGLDAGFSSVATVGFRTTAAYVWGVIAFFIVMGYVCVYAGLSKDLYWTAYKWIGHLTGGLGCATIGACAAFSAVVGDTLSACMGMGAVALPEMKKFKYDLGLATGTIVSGGTIGPMIPPSIMFILYAVLAEQSIGKLFIAGILPGLLLCVMFMISIYARCKITPTLGPAGQKSDWKERVISLKSSGPIIALFCLVIGGIYGGIFTASEGGAIGACGALIIAIIMRRLTWKTFAQSFLDSSKLVSIAFLILVGAMVFSYFISASKLPITLATYVANMQLSPLFVLIGILFVYMILGCIMPAIPMVLLTVPIFYPIAVQLNFDPIWFGVLIVAMTNLSAITPPYGINLFALTAIAQCPMATVFKGALPFVWVTLLWLALLVAFPPIATWLPSLF